jgi:hypothetical protein
LRCWRCDPERPDGLRGTCQECRQPSEQRIQTHYESSPPALAFWICPLSTLCTILNAIQNSTAVVPCALYDPATVRYEIPRQKYQMMWWSLAVCHSIAHFFFLLPRVTNHMYTGNPTLNVLRSVCARLQIPRSFRERLQLDGSSIEVSQTSRSHQLSMLPTIPSNTRSVCSIDRSMRTHGQKAQGVVRWTICNKLCIHLTHCTEILTDPFIVVIDLVVAAQKFAPIRAHWGATSS